MSVSQAVSRSPTRRWVLLGAAAVAGTWAVREYRLTPPDYAGGKLSVSNAHRSAVAGEVVLIDIRTPREWRASGIGEGAHPIDMRRADFVQALTAVVGPDRSQPIALICARGVRSARLSLHLTEAGFTNIIDVPEGMLGSRAGPGWVRVGLPLHDYEGDAG
ncbi:rhodanese-like domain-containing protein [Ruegeria sp. HKCCD8929]|uniref:rhodanese-like domain-containing protein n=1 Tax=Ruegeria sp. HKCCD8929 TaxID=2683006 RepID=UPI001487BD17|nr:rhodanese-like domain-containing protein [Ruegeria sp. HKCCD8929]